MSLSHKLFYITVSCLLLTNAGIAIGDTQTTKLTKPRMEVTDSFLKIPMHFEKNEGQIDRRIHYRSRGPDYQFAFMSEEILFASTKNPYNQLHMRFIEANPQPMVIGLEQLSCHTNYFIGNDPQQWHTDLPNYAKVVYQDLYPGINAVFYGNQTQLEYDLHVAAGQDPQQVRLQLDGAQQLQLDPEGNLQIILEQTQIQMLKPIAYQLIKGKKVFVDSEFAFFDHNEIGFTLGSYDSSYSLIIDPLVLGFSTYLGGSDQDGGLGIAVDSSNNIYITGATTSSNFPTLNPYSATNAGAQDVFVTKMNENGTELFYSTYLGGSDYDVVYSIALDSLNNAYITGQTKSSNFPTTLNAFQSTLKSNNGNIFVTKLNATGNSLGYSTYLGGTSEGGSGDDGFGITVAQNQYAYITGAATSSDFPTTSGAYQPILKGSSNAIISVINPHASSSTGSLVYSTFLGGSVGERGYGIALDEAANVYITGFTGSTDFPTTAQAFQSTLASGAFSNVFISGLNVDTNTLLYSTYLGGSFINIPVAICLDSIGNFYVTGQTFASNFPVTPGAYRTTGPVTLNPWAFETQLSPTAGLLYSTYVGEASYSGLPLGGITLGANQNIYITGTTFSSDFPTTSDAYQPTFAGITADVFFTEIDPRQSGNNSLIYSTFLGGFEDNYGLNIAANTTGTSFYLTGHTTSSDFPTTAGVFQTALGGPAGLTANAFVARFDVTNPIIETISPASAPVGSVVTITGINFSTPVTVLFGTVQATVISVTDTAITVIVPPQASGVSSVSVMVTTAQGTSNLFSFTYLTGRVSHISKQTTKLLFSTIPTSFVANRSLTLVAQMTNSSITGTVTFYSDDMVLGTVFLKNGVAQLTTVLTQGMHYLIARYNGNANYLPSQAELTLTSLAELLPPTHLQVLQHMRRINHRRVLVNVLTWQPSSAGVTTVTYYIYRDAALQQLIGIVPANQKLEFIERHRRREHPYIYYIVAVDSEGNRSQPASVSLEQICESYR